MRLPIYVDLPPRSLSDHGLCANYPADIFFPDGKSVASYAEGKTVCRVCSVQEECLSWALRTEQPDGLWGGLSPKERHRIIRHR